MAGAAVRLNHLVLDCRFNGAFNKTENYFEGVYPASSPTSCFSA